MKLPKFTCFSILMLLLCTAFASFATGPPGDEQITEIVVQDNDLVANENIVFVALLNKPTVPFEIEVLQTTTKSEFFFASNNQNESSGLFYRRARDGC